MGRWWREQRPRRTGPRTGRDGFPGSVAFHSGSGARAHVDWHRIRKDKQM